LGSAYFQAKQLMANAQALADPAAAARLNDIDSAFSTALRVNRAAGARGGEPGLFTPSQLQDASRHFDETLRDKAFSQGQALMQPYANAARTVLGNTVPDSGTALRQAVRYGLGAALAAGAGEHLPGGQYALPALGGLGGLAAAHAAAYSPLGLRLLNLSLTPQAAAVANSIRQTGPFAASAVPFAFGSLAPLSP